uniref:HEAT repeat containing 3 n=1 Tax=Cyclopterus lumpus TaxID=8103 RepID=A0A8C3AI32_CYCLU
MGKSKTTKFKRPQFNAVGLPVKEADAEEEDPGEDSCPAAELLEKLQSPSADVREFACASISRVVQQSQTIPVFLQRDAVRRLGPMLLDKSLAVRETAAGALRNLSACGGQEACEDMVKHDVMTPLTALLREVRLGRRFYESSSQSLSVFNKAGLLDLVVQCLERHPHNVELAISAAHCLHTVTEDNPELLCGLNAALLGVVESVLLTSQPDMAHTLLRTLAAGTLWNMKGSLPAARQAQTLNAVVATLSQCLDLDIGTLIPELRQAEEVRHRNASAAAGVEDQAAGELAVAEMDEEEEAPKRKSNGKAVRVDNDFSDLLPRDKEELKEATALLTAQQTSLEIIVNMCCSDDPSDDEWEEESSSDESDMGPDGLCDGVSNLMSPLCLSAEVHEALIQHSIPEKANTCFIINTSHRSISSDEKGVHHSVRMFTQPREIEAATRCDVVSVRVNAVAILGITGSTLAKEKGTAETLQMIGNALLQVATKDTNLVVNGEALDALLDVFADGDEAETACKHIQLLPALKAFQPVFKAKIRKEGRGKYSPQQLCVLDNIKVNLRRFIGYLEKVVKK